MFEPFFSDGTLIMALEFLNTGEQPRDSLLSRKAPGRQALTHRSTGEGRKAYKTRWGGDRVGVNRDEKSWEYACQNCGTPYASKPKFCYDCGGHAVVPVDRLRNVTDDSDE